MLKDEFASDRHMTHGICCNCCIRSISVMMTGFIDMTLGLTNVKPVQSKSDMPTYSITTDGVSFLCKDRVLFVPFAARSLIYVQQIIL